MSAGLLPASRRLLARALDLARTRIELAATELDEQILHHAATFLGALLTVLLGTLAAGFTALALIIVVGEAHRLAAALGLAVLFAVLAVVAARGWRATARAGPQPFQATLAQLERAALAAAEAPHVRRLDACERLLRLVQGAAGVAFTVRFLLRRG